MLNIVIPMAGRGKRFADAGYERPKPLIEMYGHTMIEYVTANIRPSCPHRFIYICQEEHLKKYGLSSILNRIAPGCVIISIKNVTEGAACTVLLAEKYIDNYEQLMIANSDQFVDIDINTYLSTMDRYDGLIMTMPASDPKWSYIAYNSDRTVTMVREKEVISGEATVGIYNYLHGSDFVRFAHRMIEKDIRVNGEFYVAPVYNEMIAEGRKITFLNVGGSMYGMGTPDDLTLFMKTELCRGYFVSR